MSPEQVSSGTLDARSDLFSVGIVLAEMVTGRRLFTAANDLDILLMVRDARLDRLHKYGADIEPGSRHVRKALQRRPRSAGERRAVPRRDRRVAVRAPPPDDDEDGRRRRRRAARGGDRAPRTARSGTAAARGRRRSRPRRPRAERGRRAGDHRSRPTDEAVDAGDRAVVRAARRKQPRPPLDSVQPISPRARRRRVEQRAETVARAQARTSSPIPTDAAAGARRRRCRRTATGTRHDARPRARDRSARDRAASSRSRSPTRSAPRSRRSCCRTAPDARSAAAARSRRRLADARVRRPHRRAADSQSRDIALPSPEELARKKPPTPPALSDIAEAPDDAGEFSLTSPLRVLFRLMTARATGLLVVAVGGIKKEIYVRDGQPEYVSSNVASELFGNYLVSKGVLSDGELAMALAMMPHYGGKLGDTLVGLGLLKPLEVFRHLTRQVRTKIIDVCTWNKGGFGWYAGRENPREAFPLDFNAFEILGAGAMALSDDVIETLDREERLACGCARRARGASAPSGSRSRAWSSCATRSTASAPSAISSRRSRPQRAAACRPDAVPARSVRSRSPGVIAWSRADLGHRTRSLAGCYHAELRGERAVLGDLSCPGAQVCDTTHAPPVCVDQLGSGPGLPTATSRSTAGHRVWRVRESGDAGLRSGQHDLPRLLQGQRVQRATCASSRPARACPSRTRCTSGTAATTPARARARAVRDDLARGRAGRRHALRDQDPRRRLRRRIHDRARQFLLSGESRRQRRAHVLQEQFGHVHLFETDGGTVARRGHDPRRRHPGDRAPAGRRASSTMFKVEILDSPIGSVDVAGEHGRSRAGHDPRRSGAPRPRSTSTAAS